MSAVHNEIREDAKERCCDVTKDLPGRTEKNSNKLAGIVSVPVTIRTGYLFVQVSVPVKIRNR
jgi:hypothetical protein